MSKILYLSDCYLKEWDAAVAKDNGKYIVLDQTAFYPNSGGQPCDTGTMKTENGNEYKVVYVGKFSGDVSHEVDNGGLKAGDKVHCRIDWDRRYKLMRMHTAAHVFSRVIFDETGAVTSGNQLDLDKSRIDFTLENLDKGKIKEWEKKANEIIAGGRNLKISFYPREEAFKIPDFIRTSKLLVPEDLKTIRIVEIEGLDQQACGGTHLKNISEIGKIEVLKVENKGKNNRRIYFRLIQ
ncbi:MAG: alanyl-tRNA editing protein AlaX [Candidatus Aenigmarchaeota archaeon CG_4_10_14_0_8_um_filter_37_24]|nr:alanyl-tRNA editing protein [Candidatus Aenigmarchaeota archaeon]OIN87342.1 MAG: hypothetical protein AUJ50_02760 [Candidatus Aenigmarchaeota archaeon CG1_02_38_14]PIW41010.1 MAG: alanyl-tRNA editing protein AlaX [Candidatus Aenigmarchaeota archaeon CG15_BIG_FIL_POST_REV_8_21_14_020_37_27]PIY35566.1 MAG: alanyl-tRNA editing protein AlaX [Candidatus Aenigmarchaeota archaeon CG_4_10_14_3_um_filter_37_21]PIZ35534.1 MAG: alanyl-tRNA editing protein AlaX [Candidatus Aenigmarchaeota archaeon CG_4_